MVKPWVHLHVHTEFSMLDGLGSVHDYVAGAVRLEQPALAMTDHGAVMGAPEFYQECRKAGIEPVIGEEFYLVDDVNFRPEKGGKAPERYHFTVLAKGYEGWKTLVRLSTLAHQNYYYKPVLDRNLLESIGDEANNLVVLSGCAGSRLSSHLRSEDQDQAIEELLWWREIFPNYYLELMHHDTDFDKPLNEALIELGQRYQVPHVITNDPHYVDPEDAETHDIMLAIGTGSDVNAEDRFRFDGTGYHLRSRAEMRQAFRAYSNDVWKAGARATVDIAKECHIRIPQWEQRVWQIPAMPGIDDPYRTLKKKTIKGLKAKGVWDDPKYQKQAKFELKVMKETGVSPFMLVTEDCVTHAQGEGIRVGPGRGSVCGTLVGYGLGIHKVDPIKYGLRFDRFLNPARPRMPDIDTDFSQARRKEMFTYVEERYGKDNVVHVCTYGRMKVKGAFQNLASAYGVTWADRMRLTKEIIEDEDEEGFKTVMLPEEILTKYPDLHRHLMRLNGVKRQVGQHPAGVIIAGPDAKVREQVPEMYIPSSKTMVGQFDLEAAEATGLMKQDFLGLRCLDTIGEAVELVERRQGIVLDPDSWVPDEEEDDHKVYKMLALGKTAGVFQMEGGTNTRGCQEVKPANFEDIVSITSLYRTGPIMAGFPKMFNDNRRQGEIPYAHPSLEQFLGNTWGVILYQEQVMDIAEHIAGFDSVMVDDIKEAIKHKRGPLMLSLRPVFVKGVRETVGMKKDVANELWGQIEGYSGYSYNRSHAVAYSLLTYQTARLKRFYPTEFYSALLRTVPNDKDNEPKRARYLREAVKRGHTIKAPHINISDASASPDPDKKIIYFGFSDLRGIGAKQAAKIIEGRPEGGYTKADEVVKAVNNTGVSGVLSECGVLEPLGVAGSLAKAEESLRWQLVDRMAPYRAKYDEYIERPEEAQDLDDCCIIGEITSAKEGTTKNATKYMTWEIRMSTTDVYTVKLWSETSKYWSLGLGSIVMIRGRWEPKWANLSCGNPRAMKVIKRVKRVT
jgi:DNA polymerase-3 subunit alpha